MQFDLTAFIFNEFVILFLAMALGNLFGDIKIKKFNFGIAGTLFLGLGLGYFLTKYASTFTETSKFYVRAQSILRGNIISGSIMNLSLLIFIVGTGLLASKEVKYALTKFGKEFVAIAVFVPFVGAVASYGFTRVFNNLSPYQVTGTYAGALTSSAGLAAAIESANDEVKNLTKEFPTLSERAKRKIVNMINSANERDAKLAKVEIPEKLKLENIQNLTEEEAAAFIAEAKAGVGVGYAIGYPFGVLFLIIGINLIPAFFRFDVEEEKKKYFLQKEQDLKDNKNLSGKNIPEVKMDFVAFSLAAFLGYFLGNIQIYLGPLGYFSFGNIGGAMIMSLILGTIGKIGPLNFRMDNIVLGKMRTYFLSIFLAAIGINYGYKVIDAVLGDGLVIAFISILVAIISVIAGFLLGHYVFKINWTLLSGAITGGMTSAPGLGAAIDALGTDEPAISYGSTQPLATLCMVIFSIIIHKLPL